MPCSRSPERGGSAPGGSWVPGGDPPGRLLLRAVRILLECILVFLCMYTDSMAPTKYLLYYIYIFIH